MKSRMFSILAGLSMVLCMSAIIDRLTVRQNMHWFEVLRSRIDGSNRMTHGLSVTTGCGVVIFTQYSFCAEAASPPPTTHMRYFGYGSAGIGLNWKLGDNTLLVRAGFGTKILRHTKSANYSAIWGVSRFAEIPNWFLAVLMSVIPMIWFWKRRRSHTLPGFCAACGYDLRATPDRCPECGTIPAKNEMMSN
jgi:hypothetical protein